MDPTLNEEPPPYLSAEEWEAMSRAAREETLRDYWEPFGGWEPGE
jgi:hypothetical protein